MGPGSRLSSLSSSVQSLHDIREVLHSVRRNFLDGMLRSECEFRKLIPKRVAQTVAQTVDRNGI